MVIIGSGYNANGSILDKAMLTGVIPKKEKRLSVSPVPLNLEVKALEALVSALQLLEQIKTVKGTAFDQEYNSLRWFTDYLQLKFRSQ